MGVGSKFLKALNINTLRFFGLLFFSEFNQ